MRKRALAAKALQPETALRAPNGAGELPAAAWANGRRQAGAILAPYAGEHGWYWLNLEDHPVTIQLEAVGFYDEWVAYELGE